MKEIWKNIVGYETYQISNFGNIKSLGNNKQRKEKFIKTSYLPKLYECVRLCKNGKSKKFYVHRLVAYAWIGKPKPHQIEVLHWDDNPKNNHYLNLRWGTHKENMNDMIRNNVGFKHFLQKYDDNLVYEVYQKRELGYSISELQKLYKGQITPSSIMHMTSGKMLRDRGLLPKK